MADYTTQIEQLYVAYFDRPADVYGLAFWNNRLNTGGSISEISNQFSTSAEYLATFAGLDLYQTVTRVYQNLFNRAPDTAGLVYWVTALTNHSVTIANVVEVITNAALANPASEVDHVSIVSKVAAATAFTHALVTPEQIAAYSGSGPALVAKEWLAPIHDAATLAYALDPVHLSAAIAYIEATPSSTTPLTTGQDNLYGTAGNDVFTSTQATLQLGDSVHGGAGQDKLTVDISGAGIALNGFATDSVETIQVKSLSTSASTVDFSDVVGLTQIVSNETDGAPLTFQDIQSVNGVAIKIIDTLETHNFTYDTHAYTSGVDAVDLTLQEIRNAEIHFATTHGTLGDSLVDQVNIHSVNVINKVADLKVGGNLNVINIDGNADLRIVAALDPNLTTVDAHGLNANLRLLLSDEARDITVTGAQLDNYLDFGAESHKKTVITWGGDDTILALNGLNNINAGDGDNTVYSGAANDTITTGAGDDFISDLGGNNTISSGGGNDVVDLYHPKTDLGNDSIVLGSGDDRLIIDAHDLEVYDTIIGGTGIDTIELHNFGSSDALGHVLAAETQRTSGIEVFDLRDTEITLALTDHLVETADGNSLTVRTIDSAEDYVVGQTIDIRGITTPQFHVGLQGGVVRDTVIANEYTVNSSSSLAFGDGPAQDTLVIYGDANISATDTINITGLERIELKADTTEPSTWSIDLTTGLLEQTTGTAPLYIVVSPNTPQGSILYLNTVGLNSAIDVYVERNSNVKVVVNGTPIVVSGIVSNATYNNANAAGELFVQTELHFTTNADSLVGSSFNDTFYADSTAQIGPADYANGDGGTADELVLGAGLYNGDTIRHQFDDAKIKNIEVLTISDNPGYAVWFSDADSYDFNTFNLTAGDDVVTHAQSGHTFNTGAGDDLVTLELGALGVTVNGGSGYDEVHFTDGAGSIPGSSSLFISEVEYVHGSNENNTVTILGTNTVGVHLDLFAGNDVVQGSSHADNLTVDGGTGVDVVYGNGGDDTLFVQHVELVYGDRADSGDHSNIKPADFVGGNDTITTTHDVLGDTPDTVIGGAGNDTITLLNSAKDTVVFGYEAEHTGSVPVAVSSGNDTIYHFAAGAINPGPTEDVLDFSGLIAHSAKFGPNDVVRGNLDWGIDLVNDGHFNIAVVWNANPTEIVDNAGTTFTTFWHPGHIAIANNGEAVIAFTSDAEGDNVENVTLAYVCDTDAGAGQTWEVTIIGTVHFDQLTGLNSSGTLNAENFHVA